MWRTIAVLSTMWIVDATLVPDEYGSFESDLMKQLKSLTNGVPEKNVSAFDIHSGSLNESEPQRVNFHMGDSDENKAPKIGFRIINPLKLNPDHVVDDILSDGRRRSKKIGLRGINRRPQTFYKNNKRNSIGNATDTKNFPYMAAIIINGKLWCAGSLVDENWVLTAAHCLNFVLHVSPLKSLGHYVKVRVGSAHPHEGGILLDVVGAVRHPKFEEEPVPHADVALLKLSENLQRVFGRYINVIKIYEGVTEPFAQSFVSVSGWGSNRGSDTAFRHHTPDMGYAHLKVRSQSYCMDAYQLVNGFLFTEDFFCASLRNGTRDVCVFDAGAPAIKKNRLMGIMSFGPERCGHEFQPAVFVKAFYFRDFVKATISSYKTTEEMIQGMALARPDFHMPVHDDVVSDDEELALLGLEKLVTNPDALHD